MEGGGHPPPSISTPLPLNTPPLIRKGGGWYGVRGRDPIKRTSAGPYHPPGGPYHPPGGGLSPPWGQGEGESHIKIGAHPYFKGGLNKGKLARKKSKGVGDSFIAMP